MAAVLHFLGVALPRGAFHDSLYLLQMVQVVPGDEIIRCKIVFFSTLGMHGLVFQ